MVVNGLEGWMMMSGLEDDGWMDGVDDGVDDDDDSMMMDDSGW